MSEPRGLRWDDVDWERGRLLIRSPKTEHLAGHATRSVPLFAEVEGPLREVFELAEEGEPLVLPWLSARTSAALRKPLHKAIGRAGVTLWPRLWHNLRSTRQTELERHFPTHVVCAWMGNSETVANRHYLQVTDDDFNAARVLGAAGIVGGGVEVAGPAQKSAALGAGIMHGHRGSGEKETALIGSGRGMDGQVDLQNDPYGVRTTPQNPQKNSSSKNRRRRIRRKSCKHPRVRP